MNLGRTAMVEDPAKSALLRRHLRWDAAAACDAGGRVASST